MPAWSGPTNCTMWSTCSTSFPTGSPPPRKMLTPLTPITPPVDAQDRIDAASGHAVCSSLVGETAMPPLQFDGSGGASGEPPGAGSAAGGGHAPDGVADVVGDQQAAPAVYGEGHRAAMRGAVAVEKAGDHVL